MKSQFCNCQREVPEMKTAKDEDSFGEPAQRLQNRFT